MQSHAADVGAYSICDSYLDIKKLFRRRLPLQQSRQSSVKNTTALLSKLSMIVMLPLIIVLAIVSDFFGISFLEE